MALKNHALDSKILDAAQAEFLADGYESASMRKIAARAGVTIGAIYTRYPTKDALFCALVQPLLDRVQQAFTAIRGSYQTHPDDWRPDSMKASMQMESETILHLLFDDYDRAVLLLCRSAGSSLTDFLDHIVEEKIRETLLYFQSAGMSHPKEHILRLLIQEQFHMYMQIIRGGYDLAEAKDMMHAAILYHTGGWLALLHAQENHPMEVS